MYRMVDVPVVASRTATLANLQLNGIQCTYSAMCFTDCCVHTNVLNVHIQADIGCCVVVFVEKLEFYQQSYTQRTLQVYQHLNDRNHERAEVKDSEVIKYNLNERKTCLHYIFLKTSFCKT